MKRDLKTGILFISLTLTGIIGAQSLKDLPRAIKEGDTKRVRDLVWREGGGSYTRRSEKEFQRKNEGSSLLILAAKSAKTRDLDDKMAEITYLILGFGLNPKSQDKKGKTALMWAAKNKAISVLKRLSEGVVGIDTLDMQDEKGNTALIYATRAAGTSESYDSLEAAKELLMSGANPEIKNKKGKTARFYAEKVGNTRMVYLLTTEQG